MSVLGQTIEVAHLVATHERHSIILHFAQMYLTAPDREATYPPQALGSNLEYQLAAQEPNDLKITESSWTIS